VFLVDVKGTRGLIDVYGSKWYPEGRQPFSSPLAKLRGHAKAVKGIITGSQPGRRDLDDIYVDAAVVLTAPTPRWSIQGGRDAPNVTTLKKAAAFFQNAARIPAGKSKNIGAHHNIIMKALQGVAKPRSGPLRFGSWVVSERLGGTDSYTEYRAHNAFVGQKSTALIRAYQADPYKPPEEREKQKLLISTAFRALSTMPGHPGIVGVRDFFPSEAEDKYFLVTEDVPGRRCASTSRSPRWRSRSTRRIPIAGDLLSALVHLAQHKVVHRNISPANILVGTDGRVRLTGFDFARPGTDHSRTIAQEIIDDLEPKYMAPEIHGEPGAATPESDIFSVGLVLYELFTGERPFKTPTELFEQKAVFAVKPSAARPELPKGFDAWLQKLCTFEPGERPTPAWALTELKILLDPSAASASAGGATAIGARPEPAAPQLDYSNLLAQTQLTPKYVIEKRLGKPGSFGVAYKVIDTLGDVSRAMKLVLRDRVSIVDRLKKEYKTLLRIPDHQNVVKVIDADFIPGNGPPFIVFEYIEGFDVGEMIESNRADPRGRARARRGRSRQASCTSTSTASTTATSSPETCCGPGAARRSSTSTYRSSAAKDEERRGGGSRRYLPPDLDLEAVPSTSDLVDRDLYALGHHALRGGDGRYPWDNAQIPPPGKTAADPRELSNLADIAPELVDVMLKAIAPKRADRFASAAELQAALANVPGRTTGTAAHDPGASRMGRSGRRRKRLARAPAARETPIPPNTNPYVRHSAHGLQPEPAEQRGHARTRCHQRADLRRDCARPRPPSVSARGRVLARRHLGQRGRRQDRVPAEARSAPRRMSRPSSTPRCRTARASSCAGARSSRTTTAARMRATRRTTTSSGRSSRRSRARTRRPGLASRRRVSSPSTRAASSTSSRRTAPTSKRSPRS
jgi:serine/threonine protein kinase